MGEEESREKSGGVGTGEFLKGVRGYCRGGQMYRKPQKWQKFALRTPKRSQGSGHLNSETLRDTKNLKELLEKRSHLSQEGYLFSSFSYILFLTF